MVEYKKVEEFWDRQAKDRPEQAGMLGTCGPAAAARRTAEEWKHFLRLVQPQPEWNVLDLGCGAGRWDFLLASRVHFIRGIDLSGQMIALAEAERNRRGIGNVAFQKASILEFKPEEQYDLIYFSGVLNHIEDQDVGPLLARLKGSLNPGGRMLSRDSIRAGGRKVLSGDYQIIYRTQEEYTAPFLAAGFRLIYSADSFRWPRGEGKLNKLFSRQLQLRHPRLSLAALLALDSLARIMSKTGLLAADDRLEMRHMFMLFVQG